MILQITKTLSVGERVFLLLLRERSVGALGARRDLVVLAEGDVGAAVRAAVGAVAGVFAGVIIFHILSSFF